MLGKVFILAFLISSFNITVYANEIPATEEWNPPSAGPITTWTAPLCGKGKLAIQPFFFFNRARGIFNNEGHYDSLADGEKKCQVQEQLFFQYGLTDRFEFDGLAIYQQNFAKKEGRNALSTGFSDSYLFLRYCLLEENEYLPHITPLFQLKFPTGKYQKGDPDMLGTDLMGATSGGGSYDHGYGIILTKRIKPFIFHIDTTFSFPTVAKVDRIKTRYEKYINCDFGTELILPKGLNLMLEFNGFLQGNKWEDGSKTASSDINYFTISPGIGWSDNKIQTLLAYQRVLVGKNTDANDSIVFTFIYTF